MSRHSYCDSSGTALLLVCGYGTAGNWKGQTELKFTNVREDGRDCGINGGAERRIQRDSGAVQGFGTAGRRY